MHDYPGRSSLKQERKERSMGRGSVMDECGGTGNLKGSVTDPSRFLLDEIARLPGNSKLFLSEGSGPDLAYYAVTGQISQGLQRIVNDFRNRARALGVTSRMDVSVCKINGVEYALWEGPLCIWYAVTDNVKVFTPTRKDLEQILTHYPALTHVDATQLITVPWWKRAWNIASIIMGIVLLFGFTVSFVGSPDTWWNMLSFGVFVFGGWLLLYEGIKALRMLRKDTSRKIERVMQKRIVQRGWIEDALSIAGK